MDTLSKDAEQLINFSRPNTSDQTLLEALGFNVDSSFADTMEPVWTTDTTIISLGGQDNIGQSRDLKIQLPQEDAIHAIWQMGIGGRCTLSHANARISNIVQLFKGTSYQLGSKAITQNDGSVYSQFNLALRSKAEIQPYADGIWFETNDNSQQFRAAAAGGDLNALITNLNAGTVAGQYQRVQDACNHKSSNASNTDVHFFIPLWMIFPGLKHIPDGALFTGRGQQVAFNITTSNFSECVYDVVAVNAYTYQLSGLGLFYRYARIHPLMDRLLTKEFIFHPIITDSMRVPNARTANNFNLAISAGERMKRLIFGFCPNQAPVNQPMDTADNVYGGNRLNQLLTYFPKFRIDQVELDIGGQRITVTADQSAVLQLIPPTQTMNAIVGYEGKLYDGYRSHLHTVYALDLSRFPVDVIGSTNKAHTSVLGRVTIRTGAAGTLMSVTANTLDADMLAQFDMYVFLEKTMPIHLTRGQYK